MLLGFITLGGISVTHPGRQVLDSARNFVAYYQALEESGVTGSFWERVVFSLVLASTDSPGPHQTNASPTASSS